jgi:hypothetical protein
MRRLRITLALAGLRGIALVIAAMVCPVVAVAAQDSVAVRSADTSSVAARPHSERRVFLVTNAGAYVQSGGRIGGRRVSGIVDVGAMIKLSPKNAVGGSWFITGEDEGLSTGPVLRWRRWLGSTQSIDVGVGTPIAGPESVRPGSLLGLVKYNPVPWFGVVARPELVRYTAYDPPSFQLVSGTRTRLSLGAEFGGKPGRVLGAVAVGTLAALIVVFVASGGID